MVEFYGVSIIYRFIGKTVLNTLLLFAATTFFSEYVHINGGLNVLVVSATILALLNMFVRPVIWVLTTPFRWLTLGLFNVVIHVCILWIADLLLPSISIRGTMSFILFSLAVALVNTII